MCEENLRTRLERIQAWRDFTYAQSKPIYALRAPCLERLDRIIDRLKRRAGVKP